MFNKATQESYGCHQFGSFSGTTTRRQSSRGRNIYGDTFKKNPNAQIVSFKYAHNDVEFTFGYDQQGRVDEINSSNGWSWTRLSSNDFDGWLIRNYFDRWQVPASECDNVRVDEYGVRATGANTAKMELPERP